MTEPGDLVCRSLRLVDERGQTVASLQASNGTSHLILGGEASPSVHVVVGRGLATIQLLAGQDGRQLTLSLANSEGPHITLTDATGQAALGMVGGSEPGFSIYRDGRHAVELGVHGADSFVRVWTARSESGPELRA